MARDAEATRDRIRRAAIAEFSANGYGGGRIERVARAAGANVRMIYAYFGGKDGLFDAALAAAIDDLAHEVPPTPDDLPGWVGRLFDHHARRPEAMRLSMWAQLERPRTASQPSQTYLEKTARVTGPGGPRAAVDLLVIVYAVAQAWFLSPTALLASDGSDPAEPARVAEHRDAVVRMVAAMIRGA